MDLDRDDIEQLRQSAPVEVVLVALGARTWYSTGSGWTKATCPFHDDEHPSAAISPDGTYFFCRACDAKGDVFDVVRRAGLAKTFPEAVEWVRVNAVIPGASTTDSS